MVQRPLSALGVNSLAASRLVGALNEQLRPALSLRVTAVYDFPSIRHLAEHILHSLGHGTLRSVRLSTALGMQRSGGCPRIRSSRLRVTGSGMGNAGPSLTAITIAAGDAILPCEPAHRRMGPAQALPFTPTPAAAPLGIGGGYVFNAEAFDAPFLAVRLPKCEQWTRSSVCCLR